MTRYNVQPYLFDGYWADVGTIESFYEANVMLGLPDAPFRYWDPAQPIYTHLRHLPGSRLTRLPGARLDRRRRLLSSTGAGRSSRSSASARTSDRARTSTTR